MNNITALPEKGRLKIVFRVRCAVCGQEAGAEVEHKREAEHLLKRSSWLNSLNFGWFCPHCREEDLHND